MSEKTLQCTEVWGGNQLVASSVRMTGLDAWVYSRPYQSAANGGDVYYVSSCLTGRITRLLVADVAGHGSAVASLAGDLRLLMRQHVNHIEQVAFVRHMNDQFVARAKAGTFATAVVTTFFAPTGHLEICNAGHPPPLFYDASRKAWRYLEEGNERQATSDEENSSVARRSPIDTSASADPTNLPFGIIDMTDYEQFTVVLHSGDLVVCYTDCLPEARRPDGRQLGQTGLLELVRDFVPRDAQAVIPELIQRVSAWAGGPIDGDDVTLLLFTPNPETTGAGLWRRATAPARLISHLVSDFAHGRKRRWPDLKLANWIGTWLPWAEGKKKEQV